jgi:aconitate hydratase
MALNLTQKIIAAHLAEGIQAPGREIGLVIDQTLTQDATGTMAALEFEALRLPRVRTEISVSYADHNLLQADFKNPDDHRYLRSFAARYGLWFSPPGNGICHQLHLINFARPGATLIGSDSHTPHCGGLAMLALGAGGLDVAAAMAGYPFYFLYPRVVGVYLTGRLGPWVHAKDIILHLLKLLTVKGGIGKVLEYYGPGVSALSVPERAAVCNMGAELGATGSIFPSDARSRSFLEEQGRGEAYIPLAADKGAAYDETLEIDLGSLTPLVACPSSPDKVREAAELEGQIPLEQIIVGSCAGSNYEELMSLALGLANKKIAPGVNLYVNPGSRQALAQAAAAGGMELLLRAGATVFQPGCLGCIGMSQAPATGSNSLRTFPRNFPGRSGSKDDAVYLCGTPVALASALSGYISDPRSLGEPPQAPPRPDMAAAEALIPPLPLREAAQVELRRGPNIAPYPDFPALSEDLHLTVILKAGDNITTDHIAPAGAEVLPLRSNVPALSRYVFAPLDKDFARKAQADAPGLVIGGENYGQGSSREHAALAPRYLGISAKLAKSFARIHLANLINFGIVPLLFADKSDYDSLQAGDKVVIKGIARALAGGEERVTAQTPLGNMTLLIRAGARDRKLLVAGGLLNYIRLSSHAA